MIYGYTRVSTEEQKTEPQILELVNAGVPNENIFSEHISGGVVAHQRPVLGELLQKLKEGDTLTVVKLDRLGRDAIDVLSLIRELKEKSIGVRILQLGADTSGSAGSLIIGILASVASWEREIIKERTKAGIKSFRNENGGNWGRRKKLSPTARDDVKQSHANGQSIRAIAQRYRVSRDTIYRILATS